MTFKLDAGLKSNPLPTRVNNVQQIITTIETAEEEGSAISPSLLGGLSENQVAEVLLGIDNAEYRRIAFNLFKQQYGNQFMARVAQAYTRASSAASEPADDSEAATEQQVDGGEAATKQQADDNEAVTEQPADDSEAATGQQADDAPALLASLDYCFACAER